MSQQNVELVRASVIAFNRGDLDAALKDTAPEFEIDTSSNRAEWRGYFRGRDGIEVQARTHWVWTVRDRTITHLLAANERSEALEAAGLSE